MCTSYISGIVLPPPQYIVLFYLIFAISRRWVVFPLLSQMRRPELIELKWFACFIQWFSDSVTHLSDFKLLVGTSCSQSFFYWSHPWAIPLFLIQEMQVSEINFCNANFLCLFYFKSKSLRRKNKLLVIWLMIYLIADISRHHF